MHFLRTALLAIFCGARASIVPPGFVETIVTSGLQGATAVECAPDGRIFVTEKQGTVWIVKNGVRLSTPFIDLQGEVHNAGDKGLLGLALDPGFTTNGFVYLLYGVDPVYGPPDEPASAVTFGRLTRYTAVGDVADTGSRVILLGHGANDGFAQCTKIHGIGTVRFAHDGTLFVGAGDGAWADRVDFGQNDLPEDPDCEATFGPAQDVGSARSQILQSMSGKILRIDPATGRGLSTNPFWNGDPDAPASKIWVLGLRNPFRFSVRPGSAAPGTLFISEVGWSTWEELNVAKWGGENFGWPCREGDYAQPLYDADPRSNAWCDGPFPGELTDPILSWSHDDPEPAGFTGFASTGNVYYDGTSFPAKYQGGLFFCDFGGGWIRCAQLDAEDRVTFVEAFAFAVTQPVDMTVDPSTGDLLYVSMGPGRVVRISFAVGDVPPVAKASATPSAGPAPLTVAFSSDGTVDANGGPMTFAWDFGDGSAPSTEPNPSHVYAAIGTWDATLVVTDDGGLVGTSHVIVETQNMPPDVTLVRPVNGDRFQPGELIAFEANASDREDGAAVQVRWEVQLVHNSHVHPEWFVWDGPNPPLFPAEEHSSIPEDRFSYRVIVTATDGGGLTTSREAFMIPATLPSNEAPRADLRVSATTGTAPFPVYFNGSLSWDADADVLFPAWDFGDGFTSSEFAPSHIYGSYGDWNATLTVSDVLLASGTASQQILVLPGRTLECHWPFEERGGPTANDASLHLHDAVITGTTIANGILGWAYRFDGIDDRVTLATPILDERPRFTIAAWIAPDSFRSGMGIVGQRGAIAIGFVAADSLGVVTGFGGETRAPYRFRAGEWHHVAAVGTGTELKLLIDGVVVARGGAATYSYGLTSDPVHVGWETIMLPDGAAFAGVIDEVRIYDDALTDEELLFLGTHPKVNRAPYVNVGDDRMLSVGDVLELQGSVSDDGEPAPGSLAHAWSQTAGPMAIAIEDPSALVTHAPLTAAGTFTFRLSVTDGELTTSEDVTVLVRDVGQVIALAGVAAHVGIESIGPNPSRGIAHLTLGVVRGRPRVNVAIVDISGRAVKRFAPLLLTPGRYRLDWDGRGDDGRASASGIYFVVVDVGASRTTEKIVLLK